VPITIDRKEPVHTADRGKCTYLRLWGEDRVNLQKIAAWSGRSTQDVGEDLMRQAMAEVLAKTGINNEPFEVGRRKRRRY